MGRIKKSNTKMRDEARKANGTRHRKRRKKNYTLYYILILFLIVVTGVTLSITVFFNTKKITVEGVEKHTPEEIVNYTGASIGDNLFRMNLTEIADKILKNTIDLDGAEVTRKLPDTLSIKLIPSEAGAAVYNQGAYYIVSTGGRIIDQVKNLDEYPGLFVCSGAAFDDVKVGDFVNELKPYQTMQKVLKAAESREIVPITAMELTDSSEIKICYADRITIYLGNVLDLDYKLDFTKQLLTERITAKDEGILDARTDGTQRFQPMTMVNQIAKGKAVNRQAEAPAEPSGDDGDQVSLPDTALSGLGDTSGDGGGE